MKPRNITISGAATEEVSALIATLHQTGQRLQELTAGEVDTVGDREGRMFVLQHAQDQLRRNEGARQAAILNALPANIALLDAYGLIISVNEAWRRFASANALHSPGHAVGLNYLEICDSARGHDASDAHQVAQGIRAVLDGAAKTYSIEYPCHSPTEERWFLLMVTPLSENRHGVVIMHLDTTAERQAKEKLRASELRFRVLIENVSDVIIRTRQDGVLEYVSPSIKEMGGYEPDEMIGHSLFEFMHPEDAKRGMKLMQEIGRSPGTPVRAELRFRHKNGSWQTLESIGKNMSHLPAIGGVVVTARNVTERNLADTRIKRLNRVYAVLSGINTLIVRISDRGELFRKACRIAVENGGFRMALIAIAEPESGRIVPIASAGANNELVARIRELLASPEDAAGTMAVQAVREKKAVVSNDSQNDRRLCLGKTYTVPGGSLGGIPAVDGLRRSGRRTGALRERDRLLP